jgi:hypothetical protein
MYRSWIALLLAGSAMPLAAQTYTSGTRATRVLAPTTGLSSPGVAQMSSTITDDMPAATVQLRDATPSGVTLAWSPLAGVSGYLVTRNDLGIVTTTPLPPAATSFPHVAQNDYRVTYQYRVIAQYPNGHTGPSAPVSFAPPKPVNPTGFAANVKGTMATLTWQAVPGVEKYLLGGAGIGLNGVYLPAGTTSFEVRDLPAGTHDWVIASYYPGPVTTPGAEWPHTTATVVLTSGRYRITLAGFVVEHETGDGPNDGQHDEVFAAALVQHFDRSTNQLVESDLVRSKTHGDVNNHPERVRQGRASDTGGLTSADVVPAGWDERSGIPSPGPQQFPLVLWEGALSNGQDVIVLRPILWEEDGNPGVFQEWRTAVEGSAAGTIGSSDVQNAIKAPAIVQVVGGGLIWSYGSAWDELRYVGKYRGQVRAGHDRPVGMNAAIEDKTYFRDLQVVLTREQIETELNRSNAVARGLVPVRFTDTVESGGAYTLYLRVERVS